MPARFSNVEIVTLALYLLGGESRYVDTEDIAIKANEIAPGRFCWHKYPSQIYLKHVETRLFDARNPKHGGFTLGSLRKGWMLSENGLEFAKRRANDLEGSMLARRALSKKEMVQQHRERERMIASAAFKKMQSMKSDAITTEDAETFFRVDDYVTGKARVERITRILNTFGGDPELGEAVKLLVGKVRDI
jgi:hypothetical protein